MTIRNFIQSLAAGDNVAAKEYLEGALGEKALEILEMRKQEIAQGLFDDGSNYEEFEEELEEEVEQLDELSPGTLARAAIAASDPESDMAYDKSHDPQKFAAHATKKFGKKIGSQVAKAASGASHYPRPNTTSGYDKLANRTTSRVTSSGKANKQDVKSLKSKIKQG